MGKFIKFLGEDYQVVNRGRKYHGFGGEHNVENMERGSNIIFTIILRLLGRISSGEKGKRRKFLRRKSIFSKKMGVRTEE